MSLDTVTLTGTNIPDIAAREVERAAAELYEAIAPHFDKFLAFVGKATFYADGTGESIVLHADAQALLGYMAAADPSTGWDSDYYDYREGLINDAIETNYADQPDPVFGIGV